MIIKKKFDFFNSNGYCIINLFTKKEIDLIINKVTKKIVSISKKNNKFKKNISNFKAEKYHLLNISNLEHKLLMDPYSRYIALEKKIKDKIFNKELIYIINKLWSHDKFAPCWIGPKFFIKYNFAGFRIARPNESYKEDVSGVHLDANFDGEIKRNYDNLITIWIPLKGFSSNYTLRISPKSHKFDHIDQLSKNKKTFQPQLKKNYEKKFKFIRPKLKIGQGILFHSNLLHGDSYNFGSNTRVSIDFRMVNLKKFK